MYIVIVINFKASTMNYTLYVLTAYVVTFIVIGWMFYSSHKKYQQVKRKIAKSQIRPQDE